MFCADLASAASCLISGMLSRSSTLKRPVCCRWVIRMVLAWLPRRSTPSVKMPRMKLERLSNLPTAMRLRGPLYVVPAEATLATSSVRDCSVAQPDMRATPPSSTTAAATLRKAGLEGMSWGSGLCQKDRRQHSSAQPCAAPLPRS